MVAEKEKSPSLESPYVARFRPAPAPGYGKVFFTFEEFKSAWDTNEKPIRLLLTSVGASRIHDKVGILTKELMRANGLVLATKS